MAATLMEIKSRTLLPRPPIEEDEEDEFTDPRLELVRQLLEYKRYKDAARTLGTARELQSLKHKRIPTIALPEGDHVDLEEVQIWDLFDAFQRLLDATGRRKQSHEVIADDTPIALHAADLLDSLERCGGSRPFHVLFEGRNKAQLIGLFLALLELIRQRRVRATQPVGFGPLEIHLLDATPITINEADYTAQSADEDNAEPPDSPSDEPEPQDDAEVEPQGPSTDL
jgi:segregation and condensation protein A